MVDFRSKNSKDFEDGFHKAVDEYLAFCKEIGKEPQEVYNGLFNGKRQNTRRLARGASQCQTIRV